MQGAGDYPKLVLGGLGSLRGWVAFPYGVLHQTPVGGSCFVGYLTSEFWQFLGFYMKFCPAYAPRGRNPPPVLKDRYYGNHLPPAVPWAISGTAGMSGLDHG